MVSKRSENNKKNILSRFVGERKNFTGSVARFGSSKENGNKTMLIHSVYMEGVNKEISDHFWVGVANKPKKIKPGDIISFDALVKEYRRNYLGSNKKLNNTIGIDNAQNLKKIGSIYD